MIEIQHLTKRYGEHTAVSDLSFQVESGQIYGFLGPNGAGKSTTMNICTGCLSATEGSVRVDGYDIFEQPKEAKHRIGYLPELPPLYMNEAPLEYLRFVGEAKGLRGLELEEQIAAVIQQTKIENVAHRRISALSKGYRQRVGIAQALLGNPEVIILDEPTVGLDPIQIIEIRDLIKELGQSHTVIFSSHILSEVQAICDQIIMIDKGKLIAFDTPENLEKQMLSPNEISLISDESAEVLQEILWGVDHITGVRLEEIGEGLTRVQVKTDCPDIYEVSRSVYLAFAQSGAVLLEMSLKKANLEDIFLELAEGDAAVPEPMEEITESEESEVTEE